MREPVRWGVLGAARIAVRKVIPAMQQGAWSRVVAIASRDGAKARAAADALGIERAYGSYEELIADADVEAVYNPLPNHLHVPWSARAARAGKHVLCEKPIALNANEVRELIVVRDQTGSCIGEAFMVRTHPQWVTAHDLVHGGRIGALRVVSGHFSYCKRDPDDIRSRIEYGGGALMDIGCYLVHLSRSLFGEEPLRACALMEHDPDMQIDRLTSALLEFPSGHACFSCATQLVPYQRVHMLGTSGRVEVLIPFNAPPDRNCRIVVDDGSDLEGGGSEVIELPVVNQFTVQGDLFSLAIRGHRDVPVPLEDSLASMTALDAIVRSARSMQWERVSDPAAARA